MEAPRELDLGQWPLRLFFLDEARPEYAEALVEHVRALTELPLTAQLQEELTIGKDENARTVKVDGYPLLYVLCAPGLGPVEKATALAHECVHVYSFICLHTKTRMSAHNDEPMAYLVSYVLGQMLEPDDAE